MKLLFLVALSLFGAVLCSHHSNAESEPEPEANPNPECAYRPERPQLSLEDIRAKIGALKTEVNKLGAKIKRMKRIGRETIARMDAFIIKTERSSNTCLNLDTFGRPAPVQPAPERELAPESGLLSNAELQLNIQTLNRKVEKIGRSLHNFKDIGKANIGKLNRFIEAAKRGVCGESHTSLCPAGFLHHGTSCYQEIVGIQKSWSKAKVICHHLDAHLVSLESQEENDFVLGLLQTFAPGHEVWLGLNKQETEQWTWIHSVAEPTDFSNWNTCKVADESHKCAYMCTFSNTWKSDNCDDRKRIVCEKPDNAHAANRDEK